MFRSLGTDNAIEHADATFHDMFIEKDQGIQRLVLGGGRHLPLHGKCGKKSPNLGRAHFGGVTLVMK